MAEALIGIPKKGPWLERDGDTLIQVSASITETHTHEAIVTMHPIEAGSTITDHVQLSPKAVSMEGVVVAGDLRVGEAYALLLEIFESRTPFDLITGIRVYTSMLFTRFAMVRNKGTGSVLRFNAELRQITFATSQTVAVPKIPKNAQATSNLGPKAKETAPAGAAKEANTSLLNKGLGRRAGAARVADFLGGS